MKYARSILYILVVIVFSTTIGYGGGGWPQKKKGLYLKMGYWQTIYKKSYDLNGNIAKDRQRGIYIFNLYAEYGVTDRLTTTLYLPYYTKVVVAELYDKSSGNILAKGDEVSSIGDAEFALKYGLYRNDHISISSSLLIGIPLGVTNGGVDGSLWVGDGELNTMLRVDVGGSVKVKNNFPYYNAYFGYNNRTKNFSDELRYGLELGSELSKFLLIGRLDAVKSMNNGDANLNQQLAGLQQNNLEYVNLSFELGVNITNYIGVSANVSKAVIGKQIFASPSFSFGVYLKL